MNQQSRYLRGVELGVNGRDARVTIEDVEASARAYWQTRNRGVPVGPGLGELVAPWGNQDDPPTPPGITGSGNTGRGVATPVDTDTRAIIDCLDSTWFPEGDITTATLRWVVMNALGLPWDAFVPLKGGYRKYLSSAQWGDVIVAWNGRTPGMGVHIHIQGEGCRQVENNPAFPGWYELMHRILDAEANVPRLDLAVDDIAQEGSGALNLGTIVRCRNPVKAFPVQDSDGGLRVTNRISSTMRRTRVIDDREGVENTGFGLYLGCRKSGLMIRFYDKAMQLRSQGKDAPAHHVRVELELRDEHALMAVNHVVALGVGRATCGMLRRMVNFVQPTKDTNKDRWPVYPWWDRFLGDVEGLRLTMLPPKVQLEDSVRHVDTMAGPTFAMMYEALNRDLSRLWDWFVRGLERWVPRLKPHHLARIEAWRMGRLLAPWDAWDPLREQDYIHPWSLTPVLVPA